MAISTQADRSDPVDAGDVRAPALEFRMLGPLEVRLEGRPVDLGGPRQRTLLAILLVSAGRVLAADALVDQLWAGSPPPTAVGTLHAYISNLRRALEPDRPPREPARVLASVRPGYTLNVERCSVDATTFLELAGEGHRALVAGDPATASAHLRRALDLWRGPALADLADEPFAVVEITRLEEARLQALEDRSEADLLLGEHDTLIGDLRTLVDAHPLRERLRGQLMLALYRAGRQSEALEVARSGRRLLAEELGLDPDPAVRALEERILQQDPTLDAPQVAAAGPPPHTRADGGLVEREGETAVLDRALAAAVAGSGRVVLIGGEPGIGKTRLVESFTAGCEGATVVSGRSVEGAGVPPFWPWRQALRDLAAGLDDDVLRTAVGDDAAIVADLVPELAHRLVIDGADPVPDAPTARFRSFDAATRLLLAAAAERPVIVVLEDIHWADAASIELLRYLVTGIRPGRVLVLATYRDIGLDADGSVAAALADLARQPHAERILLPGLSHTGVATLMASLLGDAPPSDLVDAAFSRTDGNPLFLTHLARLVRAEPTRRPGDVVRTEMPPEVSDLIGIRVAVLPEPTRRLLTLASVTGREFDLGLLVRAFDARADEVLALIDPSVRAGLVAETGVPGRFRFTHALIRDAILDRAGASRVAHLHGQVGDALAAVGTDDRDLAAIAEHYWRAAAVGWPNEAIDHALLAADRAGIGLAHEEEQRQLDRALRLIADHAGVSDRDARELTIQLDRARSLMRTQGYGVPEVGVATLRARELADRLGARSEHLLASWGLAAHRLVRSEHRAALEVALEMVELAERTGDRVAGVAGHQTAGVPLIYMGRSNEAIPHLERSRALAAELPPDVLARFPQNVEVGDLVYLAFAHWLTGDTGTAERCVEEGLGIVEPVGGYDEAFMLQGAAHIAGFARDHTLVLERTERALRLCETIGYRHVAAGVSVLHGWALAHLGDPARGVAEIERAIAYYGDVSATGTHVSYNHMFLADALLQGGRCDDALQAIGTSVAALEDADEVFYGPETWRIRADILAAHPAAEERDVIDSLRTAVRIAEEHGSRPFLERARLQLAPYGAG